MMTDVLGWACSFLLVLTISKQVYTQWRARSTKGVSKWLFIGQVVASAGFTLYSVLVHSWVFVVTNAMMCTLGIVGLSLLLHHRRAEGKKDGAKDYSRASLDFLGSPTPQRSSLR
jgi:MtN3 and saliva related transmembrane protein